MTGSAGAEFIQCRWPAPGGAEVGTGQPGVLGCHVVATWTMAALATDVRNEVCHLIVFNFGLGRVAADAFDELFEINDPSKVLGVFDRFGKKRMADRESQPLQFFVPAGPVFEAET